MAIKLERTSWFPDKYLLSVLDSNPGNIFNNVTQTCAIKSLISEATPSANPIFQNGLQN